MRPLSDADGYPVADEAVAAARRHGMECLILCDTAHLFEKPGAETITAAEGADSVDYALVNRVQPGDVVVTQDYGPAAMCLARRAVPLSQDGMVYSGDNIDGLLLARHTAKRIRRGGHLRGPAKRRPGQDAAFAAALEELLAAASRSKD